MRHHIRLPRQLWRSEDGASLIEYVVVLSLFLLIFFALLDFGRLGFNWVMTEKAMQRAARIATVRPPVCGGVPDFNAKPTGSTARFGSLCRSGVCDDLGTKSCVLSATAEAAMTNACATLTNTATTAQEIWCILQPILPSNATPQNIRVSYSFDPNLGFLGGPYTPEVEVGIVTTDDDPTGGEALKFQFLTPLGALAGMVGGAIATIDGNNQIAFPDLSVSLPGEDLNQGNDG